MLHRGSDLELGKHVVAGTFHGYNDMPTAISKQATAEIAVMLRRAIGPS